MTTSERETEKVLGLIGGLLAPSGWNRVPRSEEFSLLIAPGIEARLDYSLIPRSRPTRIHVTPYVEIFHHGIEQARKYITGRSLYTINEQLQYLMTDKDSGEAWHFYQDGETGKSAAHLVADCLSFAPPFYEQFRTLDEIVKGLETLARGKRTIMRESLAIAYCLQDKKEAALAVLADDIRALKANPSDIAHEQLPKYTELFGLQF